MQFKDLKKSFADLEKAINKELKTRIRKQAVDLFKRNFDLQGFQNGSLEPWKEVKRRQAPRVGKRGLPLKRQDTSYTDKILIRTRNLNKSINAEWVGNVLHIYSDIPYAEAHNEGTTNAGRNHNVTIPQRQFIGDSLELKNIIEKEMDSFFNKL